MAADSPKRLYRSKRWRRCHLRTSRHGAGITAVFVCTQITKDSRLAGAPKRRTFLRRGVWNCCGTPVCEPYRQAMKSVSFSIRTEINATLDFGPEQTPALAIARSLVFMLSHSIRRRELAAVGVGERRSISRPGKRPSANQRRLELGILPDRSLSAASRHPCGSSDQIRKREKRFSRCSRASSTASRRRRAIA